MSRTPCLAMVGPDEELDVDPHGNLTNPLPTKCSHCTFPRLDYVSNPYLLSKGFKAPSETYPARGGNFLVKERVARIFEVVIPKACTFYPTAEMKTKKPTDWWLAVPNQKLPTVALVHEPLPEKCSQCGEPRGAWGENVEAMTRFNSEGVDIFKSLNWNGWDRESGIETTNDYRKKNGLPPLLWEECGLEPPPHPQRWTRNANRQLYFSVRLEQLLKRAKVKGQLVRLLDFKGVQPSAADEAWIEEKLKLLAEHGLIEAPKSATKKPSATEKWFKQFLKKNASKKPRTIDFSAIEKQTKLTLPQDYKDFASSVGEKSFADVNDLEGSTTTVLLPDALDFKNYRRGKVPNLEGDDADVEGVMFAATDFGDCFVFDVSAKGEWPVFWYRHEENTMEPFAPNFAECIKRFAQGT